MIKLPNQMTFCLRLGASNSALFDVLKTRILLPCSQQGSITSCLMRTYATREELLERLRQAKAYELQEKLGPVHKTMWDDRRTYLLGFSLVGASCWAYRYMAACMDGWMLDSVTD